MCVYRESKSIFVCLSSSKCRETRLFMADWGLPHVKSIINEGGNHEKSKHKWQRAGNGCIDELALHGDSLLWQQSGSSGESGSVREEGLRGSWLRNHPSHWMVQLTIPLPPPLGEPSPETVVFTDQGCGKKHFSEGTRQHKNGKTHHWWHCCWYKCKEKTWSFKKNNIFFHLWHILLILTSC